ncbi:hypothetical protein EST38_g11333 [Candolleomyces aberdarensis]|uniref:DRBM domain-containing protein n=1 Tax=Candolleomyces aberdarensis TaxID=2316362 RepID=A0A4Q2D544_9AGAR|nr:hypothetical protein EST38_g11333 [Candolleomyces aberdarensis]
MSDAGSCMRFNNAAQRILGDTARPVIRVEETNDRENRWSAEARFVGPSGNDLGPVVGQGSARKKQKAKDIAAMSGLEWLRSQYPWVDLSDV